jgi:hypothetical protein
VKPFTAILFSALLVWMQIAPVTASPACPKSATLACTGDCGQMNCCASKPANSQSAPAVPQPNTQNQISLLAPVAVIWNLPENSVKFASSIFTSHPVTVSASLYARNCTLLL